MYARADTRCFTRLVPWRRHKSGLRGRLPALSEGARAITGVRLRGRPKSRSSNMSDVQTRSHAYANQMVLSERQSRRTRQGRLGLIVGKGKAGLNSKKAAEFRHLLPQTEKRAEGNNGFHASKDAEGENAEDCPF
jgi:hypothetical protein